MPRFDASVVKVWAEKSYFSIAPSPLWSGDTPMSKIAVVIVHHRRRLRRSAGKHPGAKRQTDVDDLRDSASVGIALDNLDDDPSDRSPGQNRRSAVCRWLLARSAEALIFAAGEMRTVGIEPSL